MRNTNRRRDLWIRNLIIVMQHNVNHDLGLVTYSMSLNAFSDLSWIEFRDKYANGHHSDLLSSGGKSDVLAIPFNMTEMSCVPSSLDWRLKGLVREVKNQDGRCHFDQRLAAVWVKSYSTVHDGNEKKLKIMVANRGPVSVAVDADRGFQHYRSGIYQSRGCSSRHLNHAVLVVGYGLEHGSAYWIIKNSWGPRWGEKGYIRLARDRGNMCGVASLASVPEIR
ncbi:Cathepsin L [Fasciola gigantica]|uniref:Cathepsin L n=1 Tax=Fasciola gigantica TaxID=46835 RepID=A0A504YV77_FASGI|nr:Cathepsin L [Fasciola gigantica]